MALVGFAVLFAGVVSSVLASATTSLLLAFILPVSLAGPASSIPDRLAGWGLAAGAALLAVGLLWPAPAREPLRPGAIEACRALAARLRADVSRALGSDHDPVEHAAVVARADAAVDALHAEFFATPNRPTGLSTTARAIVRLVDELRWLRAVVVESAPRENDKSPGDRAACAVRSASASVLERAADLLDMPRWRRGDLADALSTLRETLLELERNATRRLPPRAASSGALAPAADVHAFVASLDPSFRAQELSFVVAQIAANADLAAAAERRSWLARLLGRQPAGLAGPLTATRQRAGSHVERHSVWLHNSVRGAVALGLAVLVAKLTGRAACVLGRLRHALGAALERAEHRPERAARAGRHARRVHRRGGDRRRDRHQHDGPLAAPPPAILLAGLAPAAVSYAAGQGAFTLTLLILFNIVAPAGWRIGLVRVEDVALGSGVSLLVGLLFWPRGAAAALGTALSEAYADAARYLAGAVQFGMGRCDSASPAAAMPDDQALRAAAAARRLDDAFRGYLAERGAKPTPLPAVTSLVTGAAGLRLAGDAVLDLWRRDDPAPGDRAAARRELVAAAQSMTAWYERFGAALTGDGDVPVAQRRDGAADARLVDAVSMDLRRDDGSATATAVRMIWTRDHLDAARRLAGSIVEPAREAVGALTPLPLMLPAHLQAITRRANARLSPPGAEGASSPAPAQGD